MKQTQAIRIMMQGESVFLTGAPGSGKTYVLNQFIRHAKKIGKNVAVTASTGIAATHIGGSTIHSWSGLGIRDEVGESDKKWLKENDRLVKRYNTADILIIDEVSMLHGKRLDMVNQVAKWLRESDQPFGGLQVILTGDLFQLPPISRGSEAADFAHLSDAWQELEPTVCYITEQHRQEDASLLDILQAMRANEFSDAHYEALAERLGLESPSDVVVTKLYSHNQDVEYINEEHLNKIDAKFHTFAMEMSGVAAKVEQLTKSVLAPELLVLKEGAEVMFVANNFADGYANGTRGRVVEFDDEGRPVVALQQSPRKVTVEKYSWVLEEDGRERARVTQLPLRLAWAITIHKSQGMSLDSAEVDLSRAFTPSMGYVALSRVRSLDGLYLKGINNTALRMHGQIFSFDSELREKSELAAQGVSDEPYEPNPDFVPAAVEPDSELLAVLKQWRADEASQRKIPHYMVASNKTLEALAATQPTTELQLKLVPGIGPKVAERYGSAMLAMVREHLAKSKEPASTKQ